MTLENADNVVLNAPPINDFPDEYFAQHDEDVRVLADHFPYMGISSAADALKLVVLELGAGVGMHTGLLSGHFGRVLATDIFKYTALREGTFAAHVAAEHRRHGFPFHAERIDFITSSAMDLILRDNVADIGISINTFEHIPDPGAALNELLRCVKPGGYLYIQFDPIWTADTGSHFLNYVPEPWGHLVYSEAEFVARMRAAGAEEYEVASFTDGINKRRYDYFQQILSEGESQGGFTVVSKTLPEHWWGVVDPGHTSHPFMQKALQLGYTEQELMTRGMRWILRVV